MDPPPEGCAACGSTWGEAWTEVGGVSTFFCSPGCAAIAATLRAEAVARLGGADLEALSLRSDRWSCTGTARARDGRSLELAAIFTPEGHLRSLAATLIEASPPAEEEAPVGEPVAAETPGPAPEAEPLESAELPTPLRERLDDEATRFPDLTVVPVAEARQAVREMYRETDRLAGAAAAVSQLRNTGIPAGDHRVPARVYTPVNGTEPLPVVLYFHGGGWVYGDLDTHDSVCREIADRAEAVVVSVAYRRSPEAKFPAALEDAFAALVWVNDPETVHRLSIDPARVVAAGDSVGGNLAAALALRARDRGGPPIAGQVLLCPVLAKDPGTPSYEENASGYGLEPRFMGWMWEQYLARPEDAADPFVAPLRAPDLRGLPPALVVSAEYDILRDEAEQYAERLAEAGVAVDSTRYPGMVHGFIDYRGLVEEGWGALDEIGSWLRRTVGTAHPPPPPPPPPPP